MLTNQSAADDFLQSLPSAYRRYLLRTWVVALVAWACHTVGFLHAEERPTESSIKAIEILGATLSTSDSSGALNYLRTNGAQLTTAQVRELISIVAKEPTIKRLQFDGLPVSAESIAAISETKTLIDVAFVKCEISDDAVLKITSFSHLTRLIFLECNIHRRGSVSFTGLASVKDLRIELCHGPVRWDLPSIGDCKELKHLTLHQTGITSVEIERIIQGTLVEELWLLQEPIGDEIIPVLTRARALRDVQFRDTKVTETGAAAVRAAKPGLTVVHSSE